MKRVKLLMTSITVALVAAACSQASTEPSAVPSTESEPSPEINERVVPPHLNPMANAWDTDFSNSIIDLDELLVGIPASDPRDLIRPIDEPQFDLTPESDWLGDSEPGVFVEIEDDARFYPLSILTRHEIVNDTVGDVPVAVTYCPLCNTGVVFDRRFEGQTLRLGVSGLLRNSDLVMWDSQTQSLWQQVTGEAIVGELAGSILTIVPGRIVRWADFREAEPDGLVMSEDQGFGTTYGANPYEGYSSRVRPYGFFDGEIDDRFPALDRVVGVSIGDTEKAYAFTDISEVKAVNDVIEGIPVVVLWGAPDTADALDRSDIASSRGIGTAVAYDPVVAGETLMFAPDGELFTDEQTGTTWTVLGTAVAGPLAGTQLAVIPHRNEFWFAWQAFFPDGDVWTPG